MTIPEDVGKSGLADVHPVAELAGLVGGEHDIDTLRTLTRHLRGCPSCQSELVEVAAATSALRHTESAHLPEAMDVTTLPPLHEPRPGRERRETQLAKVTPVATNRRWFLAAAATLVILAGSGILIGRGLSSSGPPASTIAFARVGGQPAQGSVAMSGAGASRIMTVTVTLTRAPVRTYYEVWLLDGRTGGMVPVGVLPLSGKGTFALPFSVVSRYNAVDISLQPDNGSTVHSSDSVLRANYSI